MPSQEKTYQPGILAPVPAVARFVLFQLTSDTATDDEIRQALARLVNQQLVSAWTAERARAARALGRPPGAEGSIGKLALSNVARDAAAVHSLLAGAGVGTVTNALWPLHDVTD